MPKQKFMAVLAVIPFFQSVDMNTTLTSILSTHHIANDGQELRSWITQDAVWFH